MFKLGFLKLAAAAGLALAGAPAAAQVTTIDPNQADAYQAAPQEPAPVQEPEYQPVDSGVAAEAAINTETAPAPAALRL